MNNRRRMIIKAKRIVMKNKQMEMEFDAFFLHNKFVPCFVGGLLGI